MSRTLGRDAYYQPKQQHGMKRKGTPKSSKKTKKAKTSGSYTPTRVAVAPELKFNDNSFLTDATTTGAIVALNNMAAGDTALLRDGNRIQMKSIQVRFTAQTESLAANALIRMLIVYDKNSNLSTASIATSGTGPLDTISITSLRQVATTSRFKVLSDRVYALNNQSDTAGAFAKMHDEIYIKIPSDCQNTAFADGNAGAPISGNLLLMYFSDIAAGAGDVDINGQTRLRYYG